MLNKAILLASSSNIRPNNITVVQSKSGSSNNTSTSVTLDAAPTEGNVLLVFAGDANNTFVINLITNYNSIQNTSLSQGNFRTMWKEAGASESATVTVDRTGSSTITQLTVIVLEISGVDTASLVDQSVSNDLSLSSAFDCSTGTTAATDTGKEIACAFAIWYDDDFSSPTWTNDFISQESGSQTSTNTSFGFSWAAATKKLNSIGTQETTHDWTTGAQPEEAFACMVTLRSA